MKFYPQNSLVLSCLICSILFFTSCSKDSDLFAESMLLDQEIESVEDPGSDGSDGQDGSEPTSSFPTARSGDILINDTFDSQGQWDFENGSNIANGVMTLNSNGGVAVRYENILNSKYYATRRYRFTFDARQTVGSGNLEFRQFNASLGQQAITSDWKTYTFEANGNAANASNAINFRGITAGDVFEIDDFKMEIIGETTDPNVPFLPASVTFFADFEPNTYPYSQFGANGSNPSELNQFEVDYGNPRTTDHPDSHISAGRDGTGRAVWLGSYNNNIQRNEIGRDDALSYGEWWYSFSIYIADPMGADRIMFQARNLAPGGSSTVNALSLRQGSSNTQFYFSICDDVTRVDQTAATLGTWNGAGTGTSKVIFNHNINEWMDVVIHYKGGFGADYTGPDVTELSAAHAGHDLRSDGFVEIWIDGIKIVDHVGTTLYRYERRGGEIRGITPNVGPYWSGPIGLGDGADIYYDNVKMWNGPDGTYQDVDPSR